MEATSALEFLLISDNHHTLAAVADGLEQVGIRLNFATTSDAGREYVGRRKLDGIIVDLDVPGAHDLILFVRQGGSNRGTTVFACLPRETTSPVTVVPGANVILPQPLTPERVVSLVSACRTAILMERRRFFRYRVDVPVHLTVNGQEQRVMMTTLSEGGMAVYVAEPIERANLVGFAFELPSGGSVSGKGSVAWANNEGMVGVKFIFLRDPGEQNLMNWCRDRQPTASPD
jgi:DNA-binding response OmpR family regulator